MHFKRIGVCTYNGYMPLSRCIYKVVLLSQSIMLSKAYGSCIRKPAAWLCVTLMLKLKTVSAYLLHCTARALSCISLGAYQKIASSFNKHWKNCLWAATKFALCVLAISSSQGRQTKRTIIICALDKESSY